MEKTANLWPQFGPIFTIFETQLSLNIFKKSFWAQQPEVVYAHARQLIDCAVHFGCNTEIITYNTAIPSCRSVNDAGSPGQHSRHVAAVLVARLQSCRQNCNDVSGELYQAVGVQYFYDTALLWCHNMNSTHTFPLCPATMCHLCYNRP